MVLKIFLSGWTILLVAVLLNAIATRLAIDTWYPFLNEVSRHGFTEAFFKTSVVSKLFLFIIYPTLLGLSAFVVFKLLK